MTSLMRHLGLRGGWALLRALLHRRRWRAQFARPTDDARLTETKRRFELAGALFGELERANGREEALRLVAPLLEALAVRTQRATYRGATGGWDQFHRAHEQAMSSGFVSVNDHDEIETSPAQVRFHVVRCRFHEALRDMGAPELTEALCRSDERVFPELVPGMRFHRGEDSPDTIARGGRRCGFVFARRER
jgi:hypothetical protein